MYRPESSQSRGVTDLFSLLIFLAALMPWVKLAPIPTDTQPQFLLLCLAFAVLNVRTAPKSGLVLLLAFFSIICFAYALAMPSFQGIRQVVNYLSPLIGTLAVYQLTKSEHRKMQLINLIVPVLVVYGLAAFAQLLFGVGVLEFAIDVRTSLSRGITSLASEPNFFGSFAFMSYVLAAVYGSRRQAIFAFSFLTITNIFFVNSPISLALFALASWDFLWNHIGVSTLAKVAIFGLGIALLPVLKVLLAIGLSTLDSRVTHIIQSLVGLNFRLLFLDGSASGRFGSIFMGIYGSYSNYFFPTSPGSFENFFENNIRHFRHIFPLGSPTERPMSGVASMIYDFGLLGIIATGLIFNIFLQFSKRRYGIFGGLILLSVFVFPFSQPFYALVFGIYLSDAWRSRQRTRQLQTSDDASVPVSAPV